ncbi:MAG TPA: hypothetical protein VF141_21075, partial [Chryseolinea sp.]
PFSVDIEGSSLKKAGIDGSGVGGDSISPSEQLNSPRRKSEKISWPGLIMFYLLLDTLFCWLVAGID